MSAAPPVKLSFSDRLGAWLCRAICAGMRRMNVRFIARLGRGIGYIVWLAAPSRRRIVARNLRIVCDPMLRGAELRRMVRTNMVRTTMNLACSIKTGLMNEREFAESISIEGAEFFEESGMNGHTAISCIPHAGNWEILARIRPRFKRVEHFGSMYRRLSNPLLEKMVYEARTGYGCEMFSKEDGLRAVLKLARNGGLLGVLSDQFTQEGIFLPYFGKVTGVTPLPALLYRRCRGKGKLISVFTRNISLGKWQAVLDREIKLPEACDDEASITLEINRALERCQRENILDGFWMHHRWKATQCFAPAQSPEAVRLAAEHARLPFRIIVCLPDRAAEALPVLPMIRELKHSRNDAQVILICSEDQKGFWESQRDCVDGVVTGDGALSAGAQLEADAFYKDGPYDYLFMFNERASVFKSMRRHFPLYISGFSDNPLSGLFRVRFPRLPWGSLPCMEEDYLRLLERQHELKVERARAYAPVASTAEAREPRCYISPFSELGEADRWPESRWQELIASLGTPVTLLALDSFKDQAQAMAKRLGIDCLVCRFSELTSAFTPGDCLYAVDGALAQVAALMGVRGRVVMASRLASRVYRDDATMRPLFRHKPCYPCGRSSCDRREQCTADITAANMLEP